MKIRHACRRDIETAAGDLGRVWIAAVCRRLLGDFDHPDTRVLVAEVEGRLYAVLGLDMRWRNGGKGWTALISDLVIDPEYRNSGLGSRLIRFAEGIARVHGFTSVDVAPDLETWCDGCCWPELGYDDSGVKLSKGLTPLLQRT